MLFVKVVGNEHINVFTADNFEIYVSCVKIYRTMVDAPGSPLEVPLEEDDIVYIMDAQGNTVDSLSLSLED